MYVPQGIIMIYSQNIKCVLQHVHVCFMYKKLALLEVKKNQCICIGIVIKSSCGTVYCEVSESQMTLNPFEPPLVVSFKCRGHNQWHNQGLFVRSFFLAQMSGQHLQCRCTRAICHRLVDHRQFTLSSQGHYAQCIYGSPRINLGSSFIGKRKICFNLFVLYRYSVTQLLLLSEGLQKIQIC